MPFVPPKPVERAPNDVRGSRVLVVDDERAWRVILETDLRMLEYEVAVAQDALEALEVAARQPPQVAIIDLMLPEPMDGWGLLSEMRGRGLRIPVIFYSAYPVFSEQPEDPDVFAYASKAMDRADLYAMLPDAVRRSRDSSQPLPRSPEA